MNLLPILFISVCPIYIFFAEINWQINADATKPSHLPSPLDTNHNFRGWVNICPALWAFLVGWKNSYYVVFHAFRNGSVPSKNPKLFHRYQEPNKCIYKYVENIVIIYLDSIPNIDGSASITWSILFATHNWDSMTFT